MNKQIKVLTENWKNNKWKIFRKTPYKKKQNKFVSLELPLVERLEKASTDTWFAQSYIIAEAILLWLSKNNY